MVIIEPESFLKKKSLRLCTPKSMPTKKNKTVSNKLKNKNVQNIVTKRTSTQVSNNKGIGNL